MIVALLAFAVASVVVAFGRRLGTRLFVVAALVPAAVAVYTATQGPAVLAGDVVVESVPWIPQLGITLTLRVDVLAWVLALVVTGVGALVLLYCARYFSRDDESLPRFAAILVAFAGAMYGLVTSDDVFVLFVFWEATSVFSYLLIGHYTAKQTSRGAALQALIVTTAGGLAMLVGLVILAVEGGTSSLAGLVESPPAGPAVTVAVVLVLVGALSKSALVPFHFWLPAAMAAPTPVSAYLHAAAMVKAGIYLVARLAPGYHDSPGWQEIVVTVGVVTMLLGGYRALRQHDLKLVLAYGTVSQLGFLTIVVGYGTRDAALAGLALLVAHALFKATLFLVVGIVDHRAGTRDLRKLSGLGRQAPLLLVITVLALASMAGVPPTFGFVAKEAVLSALLSDAEHGSAWGVVALVGVVLGSILTTAYSLRFLWGAFARKAGVEPVDFVKEHVDFLVSPAVLALLGLGLGAAAGALDPVLALYADTLPAVPSDHGPYHLALWHGLEPALGLTALTLVVGALLFWQREPVARLQKAASFMPRASDGYVRIMTTIDSTASRTTAATQRGSLPFYLATILVVFVASSIVTLSLNRSWPEAAVLWDYPAQLAIGGLMVIGAVAAARSNKRFQAVVLVGVTGYGMAALFALHGAPDLALTQVLIETITLIAFVLVLRRLPARLGERNGRTHRAARAVIAISVGCVMAAIAVVALGARSMPTISGAFPELAVTGGHGKNVVNVTLVDIRGWDTMGEISVLIVAATGVASLVFLTSRTDMLPRPARRSRAQRFLARVRPEMEAAPELPGGGQLPATAADTSDVEGDRRAWLLAGRKLAPQNRSILLEVVVRLLFHAIVVVSIYLLFAGHNLPGGGFAGGLVAGMAFVARYLAGGRFELGAAAPLDAGKVLGTGLLIIVVTAVVPLFLGVDALTSTWVEGDLPLFGHVEFVTSTFFDIGVYLVVVGLVLDVLRSLGAEVDRQEEEDDRGDASVTATTKQGAAS
ncbi:multicomponent Na+:H+ antiporter subunit A [Frigoribacterium sp. PvP120]|uniref:Na+/H+ antiporter subunit A n=1 Tax=unclassified Frigoribacterium TaxID=2627005 RepID=UPI001AE9ED41|nr:Na+/H+ antiporter subunit A [Frigoribacterium sp. PvP121]MBP1241355.1 multicomponent Na+:H+ antiporter subunit A [Frigoribacterium sp. PvP121]